MESKEITAQICQKDGISLRTTSQILSELLQDRRAWDASNPLVTRAQPTPVEHLHKFFYKNTRNDGGKKE